MVLTEIKDLSRLLIYFFYDKDGIVDDYVLHMIDALKPHCSEIMVVVNGKLSPDGRKKLEANVSHVLVRENIGFDVWAYKTALEYYEPDKINTFDEVILMNATIMGPLYSFSEMFDAMDQKDIDFWGLTLYHGAPFDPFGKIKYNYLPTHLQSHFIVVRNKMLTSIEFKNYWKNMPMITCYEEAVGWHEAIFTKDFEDAGYQWDVYIDTRDILKESYCPLLMTPLELIRDRRCPIIKRRSFFHEYFDFINMMNGEGGVLAYDYIRNHLDFDTDMIWENILRLQNQADIKRNMHLNYVLPTQVELVEDDAYLSKKIALVMHLYFDDLIEENLEHARSMPSCADVYITTDTEKKAKLIRKAFAKLPCNKLEVIVIENRGRDVSALLVATKEFIMDYDYVCFCHDKKVAQLDMGIKGKSFAYKCFDNILHNQIYVSNVLHTFESNSRLGILMPPPPYHADYYPVLGRVEWGVNFEPTRQLLEKMEINVPIDISKEPVAPLGTMFWFRPVALKALFAQDWEYKDFPKEPNEGDGSLLHAIERAYPFVAQSEGYYPAWGISDSFARIEITNLYFMIREMNKSTFQLYQPNTLYNLKQFMDNDFIENGNRLTFRQNFKTIMKKYTPKPIWNFLKKVYMKIKKQPTS